MDITTSISSKLDFIINEVSIGGVARFTFTSISYLSISLLLAFIMGVWVESMASNRPSSHVLLSKLSEERRAINMVELQRDWALFGISLVASIATGIVSNIIYTKYFVS